MATVPATYARYCTDPYDPAHLDNQPAPLVISIGANPFPTVSVAAEKELPGEGKKPNTRDVAATLAGLGGLGQKSDEISPLIERAWRTTGNLTLIDSTATAMARAVHFIS